MEDVGAEGPDLGEQAERRGDVARAQPAVKGQAANPDPSLDEACNEPLRLRRHSVRRISEGGLASRPIEPFE